MNEPEKVTTVVLQDDEKADEKWDCESILSTYSNAYNHPKLITQIPTNKIRLSRKTGLPLAENNKISTKEQQESDEEESDEDNTKTTLFERKKGETSEERRARKHAVKEMRRVRLKFAFSIKSNSLLKFQDRRVIKKATKIAFKQEEQKQLHEQALNTTQAHLQSLRVT